MAEKKKRRGRPRKEEQPIITDEYKILQELRAIRELLEKILDRMS